MLPQRSCEFSAFRELDMVNSFEKWTTIFTPAVEGDGSTKRDGSTGKPNLTRSRENTFFNAPVKSLPSSLRCLHHPSGFLIRPSRSPRRSLVATATVIYTVAFVFFVSFVVKSPVPPRSIQSPVVFYNVILHSY